MSEPPKRPREWRQFSEASPRRTRPRYQEHRPSLAPVYSVQESAYDVNIEDLFNATVKLEEKEKVFGNAEGEVCSAI